MIRTHAILALAGGLASGLVFSMAPALAADCQPKIPAADLVLAGKLTMSTNPTLPPMQYVDSAGKLKGMRITLGRAIAKRLCLQPNYIRIEFSAMIPGLQAGRWDIINTGIFWNPERAAMMKMVPYESQAISVSVQKGNPEKITKPEDLAGKTVGVEIGGFEEDKLRALDKKLQGEGLKAIDIRTFDNFALAYQALSAGQTDATVSIDPTAAEYAKRGDFDRALSGLFPTPVALAMKNETLATAVVGVLNDMMKDGSYQKLMAQYGLLANTKPFALRGPKV
ncbi:ABC transporter substrate-binding protein [Jiella sp. MQZ9-1]|uniref:ABC transporter substrate-binding protein n=1 Tax=Jiella flava TaxID=2816857 RepID=A0A939FYY6_9HYPH|nr:ABC transporter substrate-binding protein [Jiella flava]MBO0662578.1 ABC transporter substrate-binding protein [Jiella flava]MCD2472949.1 ABC transporter substrate-binding protein [Jiella flava]